MNCAVFLSTAVHDVGPSSHALQPSLQPCSTRKEMTSGFARRAAKCSGVSFL